jgi:uncharacterized membrane protein YdjX (TVP38/TMEM64 family)
MNRTNAPRFTKQDLLRVLVATFLVLLALTTVLWLGEFDKRRLAILAENGWVGEVAFVLAFVGVCLSGAVPASLMAISAGAFFGLGLGFSLSAAGLFLGGLAAFLSSRYCFRSYFETLLRRRRVFYRFEQGVVAGGWRIVALLQMSHVLPFGLMNYAFGVSSIGIKPYLLGLFGAVPALFIYVYSGAVTKVVISTMVSNTGEMAWGHFALVVMGLTAIIALGVLVKRNLPMPCKGDISQPE